MTTRAEFMKNATFSMSLDGRFRPCVNGTLFDKTGKAILHSISQHVPINQLAEAIKYCATGEGKFHEQIKFGDGPSHSFSLS